MIEVTDTNFEEATSKGSVLLDCYAPWCGPCKSLCTILEHIEPSYENVKFCKCNVDENKAVSEKYGVKNVPFVLLIKDGEVKTSFNGIRPASLIKEMIDANL